MLRRMSATGSALGLCVLVGAAFVGLGRFVASQDDLVKTLVLGLADREQKLQTLQGTATIETVYDAEALAAYRQADAAAGAPDDLAYTERALHRVAFWLDFAEDRWRIEVAELMSSGRNEWGFMANYARLEPVSVTPVLVEVREGATVTHWDVALESARVDQFNPKLLNGGGHVRTNLERPLRLGFSDVSAAYYSLGEPDTLEGIPCHKLVHREATEDHRAESTLWVAPANGFAPLKYIGLSVFANDPRRGSREVIVSSLTEAADGVWLPAETTISRYAYVPERDRAACTVIVARFDALQVDEPIPDCRFQIHFPLGCTVTEAGRARVVGRTTEVLSTAESSPTPQPDPIFLPPLRGSELETRP